jgi:hypothetical protein
MYVGSCKHRAEGSRTWECCIVLFERCPQFDLSITTYEVIVFLFVGHKIATKSKLYCSKKKKWSIYVF